MTDELLTVARRVTGDDQAELVEVSVEPVAHERVSETTGGIYNAHGIVHGSNGPQAWAAVLKVLHPTPRCTAPRDWCYWKREAIFYEPTTGLYDASPAGAAAVLRPPRCHGVSATDREARIWLEYVADVSGAWTDQDLHRVARAAGSNAAQYLGGMPVPRDPCFVAFLPSILADGGWWATYMDLEAPGDVVRRICGVRGAWSSPLVADALDARARSRVLGLWRERHQLLQTLDGLPRVLCHNDLHRRNVLLPGPEEVVAVDWAFCGPGAAGADLADLVWGTLYYGDASPDQAVMSEDAALQGYLAGLRDRGWPGDPRTVRLAYLIATALRWAATLPGWLAYFSDEQMGADVDATFGRPWSELHPAWVTLCELTLERADEARALQRLV